MKDTISRNGLKRLNQAGLPSGERLATWAVGRRGRFNQFRLNDKLS